MCSPWPEVDYKNKKVMCCLCFDTADFADLYEDRAGKKWDAHLQCHTEDTYLAYLKDNKLPPFDREPAWKVRRDGNNN